jgi:hypothetical protein
MHVLYLFIVGVTVVTPFHSMTHTFCVTVVTPFHSMTHTHTHTFCITVVTPFHSMTHILYNCCDAISLSDTHTFCKTPLDEKSARRRDLCHFSVTFTS